MSWVGSIAGAAGLAWPMVAVATGGGDASAGFACAAADCCGGSTDLVGAGSATAGLASGLAFGTGTVRLATCGTEAGGRGEPLTWVTCGGIPAGPGAFYPPTVLANVDNRMIVAQEEIFGPVVTVIPFEDEKDAIRIANDTKYGLFATIWTGDPGRGHRVASRIEAGEIGINMPYTAFPGIPFGGYKQSGFGRELGLETLDLYLETKSVLVSTGAKPYNPFGL